MFTRLNIHNFRAIGPTPLEIELAPITVFVGPNGAGKTSILEALALTAQSATEEPSRRDLILSGQRIDFALSEGSPWQEQIRQIYHRKEDQQKLSIDIEILLDSGQRWSYQWTRTGGTRTLREHLFRLDGIPVWKMWNEREELHDGGEIFRSFLSTMESSSPQQTIRIGQNTPDRVLAPDLFPSSWHFLSVNGDENTTKNMVEFGNSLRGFAEQLRSRLDGVAFLSALRGTTLMHQDVGPEVQFVGKHGEQTIRLLSNIQSRINPTFTALQKWAKNFGLPDIEAGWSGGNQLKIAFKDPHTHTTLDLHDGAMGSRQGLMLATQLLLSKPGSTLLLEEPENDMHPAYERMFAELFADSIRTNHQLLITTHSELLVAALGNAVRRGQLRPEEVVIWHLERNQQGIHPQKISISEKGYLEQWISSFAKVEEELLHEWWEKLPEVGDKTDP